MFFIALRSNTMLNQVHVTKLIGTEGKDVPVLVKKSLEPSVLVWHVLENLSSTGILLCKFPGLESPGKSPLVLESSGNLLNSTKNMKCMEGSKKN